MLTVSDGGGYAVSVPPSSDGSISGGTFSVELDQIPALITGIDIALDRLRLIDREIDIVAIVDPPGKDPFSKDAARQFGLVGAGGPSSLKAAHRQYVEGLQAVRNSLVAAQAAYDNTESTSSSGFKA